MARVLLRPSEFPFTPVLGDLGLPKLNGWEAFQQMKQTDPNLNALFATGFVQPEIETEITKAQPGSVISKRTKYT
jgi:CheY-like chemotaxis protein